MTTKKRLILACLVACLALLLAACSSADNGQGAAPEGDNSRTPLPPRQRSPTPGAEEKKPPRSVTIAAAGDISESELGDQQATSDLVLEEGPARILMLGDGQYPEGSPDDFDDYYEPTWGRFENKTYPAPGNHDEFDSSGYEDYFDPPGPWYSFDLGEWHFVSLDSNRPTEEDQLSFFEQDLESDDHLCDLAFWHHPRWSSGSDHGSISSAQPLWERAVEADVDLVLVAHDHVYERFGRLDAEGQPAPDGTYEIIVGTGGAEQHDDFFAEPLAGSRARLDQIFGVLFLELRKKSFSGEYKAENGQVLDRFAGVCG